MKIAMLVTFFLDIAVNSIAVDPCSKQTNKQAKAFQGALNIRPPSPHHNSLRHLPRLQLTQCLQ